MLTKELRLKITKAILLRLAEALSLAVNAPRGFKIQLVIKANIMGFHLKVFWQIQIQMEDQIQEYLMLRCNTWDQAQLD